MNLNYNEIIKQCDANITPLETNDLDSFFSKVKPDMRGQIYVFMRDDLKLGDSIYDHLTTCPAELYKNVDSLPEKVIISTATEIGDSAFENSNITRVDITSNVSKVGANAFKNCKNLKKVIFKNGSFTEFDSGTFAGCSNLQVVLLPASVTEVDKNDFEGCPDTVRIGIVTKNVQGNYEDGMDPDEYEDLMNWYKTHVTLYTGTV